MDSEQRRNSAFGATQLERIAFQANLHPDELRASLRERIAAQPRTAVERERPESPMRVPSAEEWIWIKAQPPEVRVAIIEALLAATA